jgi:hypothetical protein
LSRPSPHCLACGEKSYTASRKRSTQSGGWYRSAPRKTTARNTPIKYALASRGSRAVCDICQTVSAVLPLRMAASVQTAFKPRVGARRMNSKISQPIVSPKHPVPRNVHPSRTVHQSGAFQFQNFQQSMTTPNLTKSMRYTTYGSKLCKTPTPFIRALDEAWRPFASVRFRSGAATRRTSGSLLLSVQT